MNPWPHSITNVTDHAMVRYLARVVGLDTEAAKAWLTQRKAADGDGMVLSVMEAKGVPVDQHREAMLCDADEHKRNAELQSDGNFMIAGRLGRYVVSTKGDIITTFELSRPRGLWGHKIQRKLQGANQ